MKKKARELVNVRNSLANIMGVVFIAIGVLGFFIIIGTFDFTEYNSIKDLELTYSDEIAIMKSELFTRWIIGLGNLVFNLAIGAILLTLDKIAKLLTEIKGQRTSTN